METPQKPSVFGPDEIFTSDRSCLATLTCLNRLGLAICSFHLRNSDLIIGIPPPFSGFLGGLVIHVSLPCGYRLLTRPI
jgi:hypothetical protein